MTLPHIVRKDWPPNRNGLCVSEVSILRLEPDEGQTRRVLAYCKIVLCDSWCVSGIRVMRLADKVVVAMPNRRIIRPDGDSYFADSAFPIDGETRHMVETAIFDAFDEAVSLYGQPSVPELTPV